MQDHAGACRTMQDTGTVSGRVHWGLGWAMGARVTRDTAHTARPRPRPPPPRHDSWLLLCTDPCIVSSGKQATKHRTRGRTPGVPLDAPPHLNRLPVHVPNMPAILRRQRRVQRGRRDSRNPTKICHTHASCLLNSLWVSIPRLRTNSPL